MALDPVSEKVNTFADDLVVVMERLNRSLQNVLAESMTAADVINAETLLNSQPAFINALRDAGYYDLAADYIAQFEEIPEESLSLFKKLKLPAPEFTTVDNELFRQLAENDFSRFVAIGEQAMTELRQGLVSDAIAARPFSEMVEAVRAATVGVDGKGSPLSNHAYTHANTAISEFNGTVAQKAGESIGFDGDDDLWEVVGVLDEVTRDVCVDALNDPVRTRAEWEAAGYWGGAPGGWNCRHILVPYIG
jgi:hypothetical protein